LKIPHLKPDNLPWRGENLVKNGEFFMIKDMRDKGMSLSQIARELGQDRKTIRKWIKEKEPSKYIRRTRAPAKIDPYRDYVLRRMHQGCVNAVVLLDVK
jgi:transposase